MTTPYTTHDAVKTKLGISLDPDVPLDAYLDGLILSVSALFDTIVWGPSVLDAGFVPDGVFIIEVHDGGTNAITLNRLLSDDSTERATTSVRENEIVLTSLDDYNVDQFPANTIYRSSSQGVYDIPFAPGYRNIIISYRGAYKETPPDVARACDEETVRAYKAGNSNSVDGGFIGITGRTPDAGAALSYTVDDLTATTMRMLDGYRKRLSFY
jgi:hypothetical protein